MIYTGNAQKDIENRATEKLASIKPEIAVFLSGMSMHTGRFGPVAKFKDPENTPFYNRMEGIPGGIAAGIRTTARGIGGGLTGIALNGLINYALGARGKELLHFAKTGYDPGMLLGTIYGIGMEGLADDPRLGWVNPKSEKVKKNRRRHMIDVIALNSPEGNNI